MRFTITGFTAGTLGLPAFGDLLEAVLHRHEIDYWAAFGFLVAVALFALSLVRERDHFRAIRLSVAELRRLINEGR